MDAGHVTTLTVDRKRLIRMLCSAVVTGASAAGSNLLTAAGTSGEIPRGAVTIACISGVVFALNDIKSYFSSPPGG